MTVFTKEEVVAEAFKRYGKPVCTDMLKEPGWPGKNTFEECVDDILIDSAYWDGTLFE